MPRTPSDPPELPGYRFERKLGSGGFSDVFLYRANFPDRPVAVKVMTADGLTDEARTAFESEANTMARLVRHPNIVSIIEAAVADDGRPYLVMEYYSGPSLGDTYRTEPFSVPDALRVGVLLAGAVESAHREGILHHDIKPANVLTDEYGQVALTDFGIASTLQDLELTKTASRPGTQAGSTADTTGSFAMSVPWSPPETFEEPPDRNKQSDVYSLAATIYTLLAGHPPFEIPGRPSSMAELTGRIVRGEITPFTRTDIPRRLIDVLAKGMAPEREDRYVSALDFARALEEVELGLGYSRTTPHLPNAGNARKATNSKAGPDETRARPVAPPVNAQPTAKAAPSLPVVAQETVAAAGPVDSAAGPAFVEATQLRAPLSTRPAPPTGSLDDTGEFPPQQRESPELHIAASRPRRRGLLIAGIAALVVIAVAVVVGINVFGSGAPTPAKTHSSEDAGGGGAVDSTVPSPPKGLAGTVSADGTSVTFTWSNSEPKSGDKYRWTTATDDTGWSAPSDKATATVPAASGQTCIIVEVVRNGQQSDPTDPAAKTCAP